MSSKIQIEEYDPQWPEQFKILKEIYSQQLGNLVERIEHVGSTAVPGLAAKPILDIDLIISGTDKLRGIIPLLETLVYEFLGDMGIKDRYAFRNISGYAPFTTQGGICPPHHLYCCLENSASVHNHLRLRDALRKHPDLAQQYGALKRKLAEMVNDDIDAYVEGKTNFIAQILLQEGLSEKDIEEIGLQNKKKS